MIKNLKDRLLDLIKKNENGCWVWMKNGTAGKDRKKGRGYAQISINNKPQLAHRVSYSVFVKEIPKSMHVLHKCDTPTCINPDHLFLGTNQDNVNDKMKKGRWRGGRPKFVPKECTRCKRMKQITKGFCRSCHTTVRRQLYGRNYRGPSKF